MTHPHDALRAFADRIGFDAPAHRVRETLEASLAPLVRRALRSGAGMPQLVQWVRATLPQVQTAADRTRPVDPDRAAPPLARLLCATLLGPHLDRPARQALETVAGV